MLSPHPHLPRSSYFIGNEMLIPIIILFITQLILPAYFIYSLWTGEENNKFNWLVKVLYSGAFIVYIFLAGRWDWLSYYLRYGFIVLFIVAVYISYRQAKNLPFFVPDGRSRWIRIGGPLLELLIFLGFLAFAIRGYFYSDQPVHLAFPLRDGWYYVAQGGNSPLLNYHNSNNVQQYALDIAELNGAGVRASGLYPAELDRYVIFGEMLYSPCEGTLIEVVDGLPDHIPPETDREHPAGNHVVIACQDVEVVLAHLKNESLMVQEGERVITGQPLGQVGNSGNTTEPHLHIHAVQVAAAGEQKEEGVPTLFENNFLVRNTVFIE